MKRGDIFYIKIPHAVGHEMAKDRPGIIVSRNSSEPQTTVNVVLLSTTERDHPAHVTIRSTNRLSQAMCQHILTVDCSRIGTYLGEATAQEMQAVDIALASNLGLDFGGSSKSEKPEPPPAQTAPAYPSVLAELAVYKELYADLLGRMLGGAR